jgi:hypothetical protein
MRVDLPIPYKVFSFDDATVRACIKIDMIEDAEVEVIVCYNTVWRMKPSFCGFATAQIYHPQPFELTGFTGRQVLPKLPKYAITI